MREGGRKEEIGRVREGRMEGVSEGGSEGWMGEGEMEGWKE